MKVVKVAIYPLYYKEGATKAFNGGSDLALAVVEVTDPRFKNIKFIRDFLASLNLQRLQFLELKGGNRLGKIKLAGYPLSINHKKGNQYWSECFMYYDIG